MKQLKTLYNGLYIYTLYNGLLEFLGLYVRSGSMVLTLIVIASATQYTAVSSFVNLIHFPTIIG